MDYIGAGVLAMTPREAGRLIGSLFVVLLLLAGLIKCFQISRRPTASTVCVSSLALLLLAWLMVAGSALLLGDPSDLAQALISVAAGVMVLTAIVLAIVGLVLFHQKPRRFEQGSGQALTTLLLGGLVLTLMGGGFVAGLIERHESLNPEPVATDDGEVIRRAHLNYQLERIEPGWISVDPKAFNERASVMLRRARPPMGFAILVEQTGAGLIDDRELAEAVHANLGAASSIARFTSPQPVRIGGIDGLELSGTARLGGHRVSYLFWVAEHNGQSIQIVGWSASEHRAEMERDVRRIRDTFRLIDADKVFQTSSELALGVVKEPTFGYRLDLRDTGWQEWTTRASDFPEAVTAGLSGTTSAMGVVPIPLHEHNPSLDQLRRALLASMGLADGGGHWALAQPWPMGDTRGERRVLRSPANPDFVYEVGVLKRPGMAYGVIAWDAASVPEHQRQAPEILDRFQLTRISGLTPRVVDLAHTRSLAEIYNRLGILEYEAGLYQRAYLYFERASRLAPDVSAYFANGVESLLDDGQGAQAQERLERFGHRFTANPRVQRLRARTLLTVGRHDEAIEQYAMLFERDQATADDLQDYVDLLIQAGRVDEADAVSEAFCEKRPSLTASLVRVHLFRVREQWQRGVAMLERLAERNRSVEVQQELADFYFQVDRSADSARVAQDLIDRGQGAAWNYFLLGRAMHDLARYREAKAAFERCVQLEPADTGYRDWLAYSSQMLGQGENWQVTTPIEPLAIPEPLQRQLAGEDLWPVPEDAGAGYLHRVTVYRFEPGQPLRKTTYRRIRIVAASALDLFTTVQIGFDPALSRLHLNHARVLDERGRILAQTRLEDVYVLDDTSSGTATQEKLLNVPIPGLRPGATLEYAWTEETLAPSDRLPYEHRLMTATLPTRIEAVALRGTVSESNVQTQGPIERRTLEDGLLFTIREPVVYRWEPHQPRLESFLPWLTMGDPDQSWEDVARDYLSEIEEQMKPTAPVVARARELTAGAATEGEKIRRVAEFVQSRLRYTAIEFGVRGRMPNPAEQTMKNAYGDCKDHAVLLHSLLQAADVPASLVLVNIGTAIDPAGRRSISSIT